MDRIEQIEARLIAAEKILTEWPYNSDVDGAIEDAETLVEFAKAAIPILEDLAADGASDSVMFPSLHISNLEDDARKALNLLELDE